MSLEYKKPKKLTPKDWEALSNLLARAVIEKPKSWVLRDAQLECRSLCVEADIALHRAKLKNRKLRGR